MKSSAPSLNIRADKRVEALLKKEMMEHQHIISFHHKEMQTLREALSLALEKSESLSNKNQQELADFKTYIVSHIGMIKDRMTAHQILIDDQKKTIESLNQQLNDVNANYVTKLAAEKNKKELATEINEVTKSHINSFQDYQREIKDLINSMKEDLKKLRWDADQELTRLADRMNTNFSISKLDKDGVLKQVRIYEKSMFIIEKKIENIYTLIERINKKERRELCHRQE